MRQKIKEKRFYVSTKKLITDKQTETEGGSRTQKGTPAEKKRRLWNRTEKQRRDRLRDTGGRALGN